MRLFKGKETTGKGKKNNDRSSSDETQHQEAIAAMANNMIEVKNHLVDNNMVVKKGTTGFTAKVFP
jgi:hypothetical protein